QAATLKPPVNVASWNAQPNRCSRPHYPSRSQQPHRLSVSRWNVQPEEAARRSDAADRTGCARNPRRSHRAKRGTTSRTSGRGAPAPSECRPARSTPGSTATPSSATPAPGGRSSAPRPACRRRRGSTSRRRTTRSQRAREARSCRCPQRGTPASRQRRPVQPLATAPDKLGRDKRPLPDTQVARPLLRVSTLRIRQPQRLTTDRLRPELLHEDRRPCRALRNSRRHVAVDPVLNAVVALHHRRAHELARMIEKEGPRTRPRLAADDQPVDAAKV